MYVNAKELYDGQTEISLCSLTFNGVPEAFRRGGVKWRRVKSVDLQAVCHILGLRETLDHRPVHISCRVSSNGRRLGAWREGGKGKQPGYYHIFKKIPKTKNTPQITATSPVSSLTVADGSQRVVVLHALTDDSPLGEDRVRTQRVHVKIAPGSHQVICADVTCVSPDSKVPVGQGEGGVLQHVLGIEYE